MGLCLRGCLLKMCVQFCINAWNAVVPLCLSTCVCVCVRVPDFRNLFLNATNQEIDRQIDKGGVCWGGIKSKS